MGSIIMEAGPVTAQGAAEIGVEPVPGGLTPNIRVNGAGRNQYTFERGSFNAVLETSIVESITYHGDPIVASSLPILKAVPQLGPVFGEVARRSPAFQYK